MKSRLFQALLFLAALAPSFLDSGQLEQQAPFSCWQSFYTQEIAWISGRWQTLSREFDYSIPVPCKQSELNQ